MAGLEDRERLRRGFVSRPDVVYSRMTNPHTPDREAAHRELLEILQLDPRTKGWREIAEGIFNQSQTVHATERSEGELLQHVVGLMQRYPWLKPSYQDEEQLTVRDLLSIADNHHFDDFPEIWGITQGESHTIRGGLQNRWNAIAEIGQELNLPISG